MILVNTDFIPGKRIVEVHGLAKGNTIRARHLGRDIMAGFRNIVGGEISDYTKMMGEAREQSLDRMSDSAKALGANGVINVRFSTSYIMGGAAEILVYGTAVTIVDE